MLKIEEFSEILLTSLQAYLPSARAYSSKQLVTKIGKTKLEEISEQCLNFCHSNYTDSFSQMEYSAVLGQMFKCLGGMLNKMSVPVTIKTITENIHLLNHAVDLEFPGYATAGFLKATVFPNRIKEMKSLVA